MAINLPKLPFKVPSLPLDRLGPRTRRIVRYAGFTLFALFVFVFALQATFPYERAKDKVIESMAEKYDVTIGSVDRGWLPGRVAFNAISVRTRPTKPGETVTTFYIDKLEVDLGILALVGRTIDVDIDAKIGRGELSGNVRLAKLGKGDIHVAFTGDALPADALPIRGLIGLPMTGKLQFDVDLALPMETSKMGKTAVNWQKAKGGVSLSCPGGCTFGDGHTKLKPLLKNTRNQVMVGDGIDFGKVTMDSLVAKVTIKGGKLTLDKFDTQSKDGTLKIDYMMTLEKDFSESMVAGCLRYKASDDLLRREPKTHAAISTIGAELRSDGLFHVRLSDRFKDMRRLNLECGPSTKTSKDEDFRDNRPNLTIQHDTRPTMPAPPPTTPVQPTAPQADMTEPAPSPPPAQESTPASGVVAPGAAPGGPAGGPAAGSGAVGSGSAGSGEHAPGSGAATGELPPPSPAMPPVE